VTPDTWGYSFSTLRRSLRLSSSSNFDREVEDECKMR
jgi:hypothetical protein